MTRTRKKVYSSLTPNLAWQLAAPHTWVAAFIGVMFSAVYVTIRYSGRLNLAYFFILLVICILMQSAVNVLNDYFDYKKGTDSKENSSEDAFDAVLVYNNLNPKSVLLLAIAYLIIAAALGIYLVIQCGYIPLIIGLIGALAVVLYSGGKLPISYLPIGEFVSGSVMGILIPLACTYVLSGTLDWLVVPLSLPLAIGIGMILATNNTCDIEKDIEAKRQTLAVKLKRQKAVITYRMMIYIWIACTIALSIIFFIKGLPVMIFLLLGIFPVGRALLNNPLTQLTRTAAMSQIVMLNVIVSAFYCLAMIFSCCIVWI